MHIPALYSEDANIEIGFVNDRLGRAVTWVSLNRDIRMKRSQKDILTLWKRLTGDFSMKRSQHEILIRVHLYERYTTLWYKKCTKCGLSGHSYKIVSGDILKLGIHFKGAFLCNIHLSRSLFLYCIKRTYRHLYANFSHLYERGLNKILILTKWGHSYERVSKRIFQY